MNEQEFQARWTRFWKVAVAVAMGLALVANALAGVVFFAPDESAEEVVARSYSTNCYMEQGASKFVAASGCEIEVQSGATFDLQSGATTDFSGGVDLDGATLTWDADGDTTSLASTDDIITVTLGAATGRVSILTGNLRVGNGTPSTSQDGEDFYIEGGFEVDGIARLDGTVNAAADVDIGTFLNLSAQSAISLTAGAIITPTGTYQLLTSAAAVTTSATTPIATSGREAGDLLILRNANASAVITVDGAGGTVTCKANIALGASDTLTLIFNGAAWNCLANYDNS